MKKMILLLLLIVLTLPSFSMSSKSEVEENSKSGVYQNPIIKGGYPDPSITYDGEYFYVVNSSFEYFPALPIHRSKDLVNWELVSYALDDVSKIDESVNLIDVPSNGGIHAPTIRYHEGRFYVITTNVYHNKDTDVTDFVNFVMYSDNIEGPWEGPFIINGTPAPGIDPDIFFDKNGRVYYVGQGAAREPDFPGEGEIWIQELNPKTFQFISERTYLWKGIGGVWAEGPHMYQYDGKYYLLIAEGGTGFEHAITIAIADKPEGPFVGNPRNPILTARHLSYDNWVNSVGHGDLIELEDGRWYLTALAKRNHLNRSSNMGRETHLLPVTWEREPQEWSEKRTWPVISPKTGQLMKEYPLPFKGVSQTQTTDFSDSFEDTKLDLEWNFRRIPLKNSYSLSAKPGSLRLFAKPQEIANRGRSSLLGFRQKDDNFEYTAKLRPHFNDDNAQVGISMFIKDNEYVNLMVGRDGEDYIISLIEKLKTDNEKTIVQKRIKAVSGLTLKIIAKEDGYEYGYLSGNKFYKIGSHEKDILLAHDNYTGAYLGLYATSRGKASSSYMDVEEIEYKAIK